MYTTKALCFFYPTTVVIVDDNKNFLENLPDSLSNTVKYQLFDSPEKALDFLKQKENTFSSPDNFLEITDDLITGEPLNVNIPKIRLLLQNKTRHETPTVVIVDYDMPSLSGIEFCQKLKDYPCKKIMLTGAADLNLAIQAFNDGIIQKFITKDDPQVFKTIDNAVHSLQQEYFEMLSAHITKNITTTTSSLLINSKFQDFFINFIKENNIIEFYLADPIGSFLLINSKNELMWLVVQSSQIIENYRQTAEDHDAPLDIINAIANKKKLLCLLLENDFNQPVERWSSYLYPANEIPELTDGFYSLVSEINIDKLLGQNHSKL